MRRGSDRPCGDDPGQRRRAASQTVFRRPDPTPVAALQRQSDDEPRCRPHGDRSIVNGIASSVVGYAEQRSCCAHSPQPECGLAAKARRSSSRPLIPSLGTAWSRPAGAKSAERAIHLARRPPRRSLNAENHAVASGRRATNTRPPERRTGLAARLLKRARAPYRRGRVRIQVEQAQSISACAPGVVRTRPHVHARRSSPEVGEGRGRPLHQAGQYDGCQCGIGAPIGESERLTCGPTGQPHACSARGRRCNCICRDAPTPCSESVSARAVKDCRWLRLW